MKTFGSLLLLLFAIGGCAKLDTYNCVDSSECQHSGIAGVCEVGGLCSFPSADCPSGKAFGELAGDQSNLCVDDAGSTSVGMTTSSGATSEGGSGQGCAALGESCANAECCGSGPCISCDEGICALISPEMAPGACGAPCQICSPEGQCVDAPASQPCTIDCGDIVWQQRVKGDMTFCDAYAPKLVTNRCDGAGTCSVPEDPLTVGCTPPAAAENVPLAGCSTSCVLNSDKCTPGMTGVTQASFCAQDATTPECGPTCSEVEDPIADNAFCDPDGICQHNIEACFPYFCDPDTSLCRTSCTIDGDCVWDNCSDGECQGG